jgi:hypothetical protein
VSPFGLPAEALAQAGDDPLREKVITSMQITKVLNRKNGVELLEVCLTHSNGQTKKTWVLKSKRIIHYDGVEIPANFATLDEAKKFFAEDAARC